MKSATTMRGVITMSMILLMLSVGFIIYSYDRDDSNVKILNDDDELISGVEEKSTVELQQNKSITFMSIRVIDEKVNVEKLDDK